MLGGLVGQELAGEHYISSPRMQNDDVNSGVREEVQGGG